MDTGRAVQAALTRTALVLSCAVCVIALEEQDSLAGTWEVDRSGTKDFVVIQDAIDAAAPGDTVLVYPGRYIEYEPYFFGALTESTFVVIDKSDITLRGTDRDNVIIGPEVNRWESALAPNGIAQTSGSTSTLVENLTVENIPQGIVLENPAIVQDVRVSGCATGFSIWSSDAVALERVEIQKCWFIGLISWGAVSQGSFVDIMATGSSLVFSGSDEILIERAELVEGAHIQFQSEATGTIRESVFDGSGVVSAMSSALLEWCTFKEPAIAFCLEASESSIVASRCVFEGGNQGTFLLRAGTVVTMRDCHILHTQLPAVDVLHYSGPQGSNIDLAGNWWGTADPSLVAEWILDANDSPDRGEVVNFDPILTAPVKTRATSFGDVKARFGQHENDR